MVVYDDAAYHLGAPAFLIESLHPHNSGTHIGMYLAWVVANRLESFSIRQSAAAPVEELRSKQLTGREFLFGQCDGRLTSELMNQEAQLFTASYYEEQYLRDYERILVNKATGTYAVPDSWANYDRLAVIIDQHLYDFRGRRY